ncbi:P-loop containing nucleoside triphosphate hydrolase protein [Aspergillus taichungensis]|uniref:P-loop containing nucleoside triphosphate hydrolase protein n=1 Tax=Aspergillus taichungensis TaxID=482145 RepID=A0A2J5I834_9EURO|nr:P-loop containing nucleoside triphosphate hydrolase protein [Aspergillus taichungensis]
MEDRFHYEAAKLENDARQKRLANRKVLEDQPVIDSEERPFNEYGLGQTSRSQLRDTEDTGGMKASNAKPTTARRERPNRISESEKGRSMQIGLEVILGPLLNKKKPPKRRNDGSTQLGPSKRSREKKGITLRSFLAPDLFEDARANSLLPGIPACSSKDKAKALLELIANVPTKNQKEAVSDKRKVLEATRKFTKSAQSDGKGGWKIKGLDTSLYHHQLLGAGFMRDRENSTHAPFGGLMCDFMGFGKTIQALANIVDGQPCEPNDPLRTTLIVVPSHLMQHWKSQILKHCDMDAMGKVLVYCAHSRMETLDLIKDIQYFSVVQSLPRCIKPEALEDEDTIREWWSEAYEKNTGPLHLIKFLRIILDEGHVIKNRAAQTSIAVRALTGKFKWILSGTPIHNHINEFYPHFDFLGVPQLGDFGEFIKQYSKASADDEAEQRLVNLLRSLMIKRTHQSKLFSLPVIKLPDLDEEVVVVNFCEAERAIYERIVDWFLKNMNDLAEVEDSKLTQSRCFLTMVLVLRMFCSHILNTQKIVKRLLSGPFTQELRNISNNESTVSQDTSNKIIAWLLAMKKDTGLRPPKQSPPEDAGLVEKIQGDPVKLIGQFRQFMCELHEQGNWVERLERTSCAACGLQPVNTVITDCMHLYCEECYYLISDENPATEGRLCAKCNSNIKEAAQCCFSDDMALDNLSSSQIIASTSKKQTRENKRKSKIISRSTLKKIVSPRTEDSDEPEGEDEDTDWIEASNGDMPGAKLSKILEIIRTWIVDDSGVKIVVFTQFLDFVQILVASLRREDIPCVCLTGKMRSEYREASMNKFSEDSSIRVMIASLKAGGIGLDMTAAHKCILVDLWWNEAIQDQAFCRLWRIGQNKPVMCIKMIVEDTIDDYLLQLQLNKTAEINNTMGSEVLENRATVKTLLEMFGATVEENENGTFSVTRNRK